MAPQCKTRNLAVTPEEVGIRTANMRDSWSDPDKHLKPDPDFALCVAMIDRARVDILDGQESLELLRKAEKEVKRAIHHYYDQIRLTRTALQNTAIAINWTQHPEYQWVAIDTIAQRADYDPQRLAEVILGGMNGGVVKFLSGKKGAMCPVCKKEIMDGRPY